MKTRYILFVLKLTFLISCNNDKRPEITFVAQIDTLKNVSKNVLISEYTQKATYDCFNSFLPESGYCKKTDTGIEMRMSQCFMTGTSLEITISNDSVFVNPQRFSCIYDFKYMPISYKLTLNKKTFVIGDTLKGRLEYIGFYKGDSTNSEASLPDTLKIHGDFKFLIRDKDFDYDKLYSEKRWVAFLKDVKSDPNKIEQLDLSNLGLKKLPIDLSRCSNLRKLNFSDNLLNENSVFEVLKDLKKLESIELDFNKFDNFPSNLLSITTLKEISLHANNIKTIPEEIGRLKNLEKLVISDNDLTDLPESIFYLKNIKEIWIDGNKITEEKLKEIPSMKRYIIQ